MTTAEIIAIGTELLLGETVDTNTPHLARSLRELGVNLFRAQIIGDNVNRISTLVREALERSDFIITTGGIGPTVDDPTREAVAIATGQPLEFRPELWNQIKDRISRYGRTPTENQKRQAYVPQNAIAVNNPVGTAPAFILEMGPKSIICLPGVPCEMEFLVNEKVLPYLQEHFHLRELIQVRTLHVSGVGEGVLDERIGDLEILSNPTVGLAAYSGVVSIRITAKAKTKTETSRMIKKIEDDLRSRLGNDIFGVDNDSLEENTLQIIDRLSWTIATLEYKTNESLRKRYSRLENKAYVGGGIIAHKNKRLLEELPKYMKKFNASVGLAVACETEGGDQSVEIALRTPNEEMERLLKYGGHPENLHRWATNMALDLLRRSVGKE